MLLSICSRQRCIIEANNKLGNRSVFISSKSYYWKKQQQQTWENHYKSSLVTEQQLGYVFISSKSYYWKKQQQTGENHYKSSLVTEQQLGIIIFKVELTIGNHYLQGGALRTIGNHYLQGGANNWESLSSRWSSASLYTAALRLCIPHFSKCISRSVYRLSQNASQDDKGQQHQGRNGPICSSFVIRFSATSPTSPTHTSCGDSHSDCFQFGPVCFFQCPAFASPVLLLST
jgi:hypothetical protein